MIGNNTTVKELSLLTDCSKITVQQLGGDSHGSVQTQSPSRAPIDFMERVTCRHLCDEAGGPNFPTLDPSRQIPTEVLSARHMASPGDLPLMKSYRELVAELGSSYSIPDDVNGSSGLIYFITDGPDLQQLHDAVTLPSEVIEPTIFRIMPGILHPMSDPTEIQALGLDPKEVTRIISPALKRPIAIAVKIHWQAREIRDCDKSGHEGNDNGMTIIATVQYVPKDYCQRMQADGLSWWDCPIMHSGTQLRMSYEFCRREGGCSIGMEAPIINSRSRLMRVCDNHQGSYYVIRSTAFERPVRFTANIQRNACSWT